MMRQLIFCVCFLFSLTLSDSAWATAAVANNQKAMSGAEGTEGSAEGAAVKSFNVQTTISKIQYVVAVVTNPALLLSRFQSFVQSKVDMVQGTIQSGINTVQQTAGQAVNVINAAASGDFESAAQGASDLNSNVKDATGLGVPM